MSYVASIAGGEAGVAEGGEGPWLAPGFRRVCFNLRSGMAGSPTVRLSTGLVNSKELQYL